jgi:hypothetical protein
MNGARRATRLLLTFACAALLAISGCIMAYNDGLPAWTPRAGRTEGSFGYHRVFSPGGGGSIWYLTPGVRHGLRQSSLVGDIGVNSVVVVSSGWHWSAILGPSLGVGFETGDFCFMVRPSVYVLNVSRAGVNFGERWQVSMLGGNNVQSGRTHISGGVRASEYGGGPVLLVDRSVGSVNLRLEGAYMLQYETYLYGPYSDGQLSLGLTAAAPAPWGEDESNMGSH